MITHCEGNLLDSTAQALVNTVNTVGVMGKGIALQFKNQFPENYKAYRAACKVGEVVVGRMFVVDQVESTTGGQKLIINFPTKTDWRKPSEYSYIERGLADLAQLIQQRSIQSIALPPLGAGNGGLDWNRVNALIEQHLSDLDCTVFVYQPNYAVQESMKAERVKLTPARAMLLSVLFDLVRNGEFASEFAAEKIVYFLRRFGAKEFERVRFEPNFYGPYSGQVRHVLYQLNGSYLSGLSAMDKKPFDELSVLLDAEPDIEAVLSQPENKASRAAVQATKAFLTGFYSPFGLELLSSVDFIMANQGATSADEVKTHLESWSDRKKTLFDNPRFISLAVEKARQISV